MMASDCLKAAAINQTKAQRETILLMDSYDITQHVRFDGNPKDRPSNKKGGSWRQNPLARLMPPKWAAGAPPEPRKQPDQRNLMAMLVRCDSTRLIDNSHNMRGMKTSRASSNRRQSLGMAAPATHTAAHFPAAMKSRRSSSLDNAFHESCGSVTSVSSSQYDGNGSIQFAEVYSHEARKEELLVDFPCSNGNPNVSTKSIHFNRTSNWIDEEETESASESEKYNDDEGFTIPGAVIDGENEDDCLLCSDSELLVGFPCSEGSDSSIGFDTSAKKQEGQEDQSEDEESEDTYLTDLYSENQTIVESPARNSDDDQECFDKKKHPIELLEMDAMGRPALVDQQCDVVTAMEGSTAISRRSSWGVHVGRSMRRLKQSIRLEDLAKFVPDDKPIAQPTDNNGSSLFFKRIHRRSSC